MKETKLYMCEYCGTQYNSRLKCKDCEANHKKAKKIVSEKFSPITFDETGYPKSIIVEMENGEKVKYKRF